MLPVFVAGWPANQRALGIPKNPHSVPLCRPVPGITSIFGRTMCFDWTMTLPDIEEAFPLGRPRPHPSHSWAFATVVAVMDQSKVPVKSQNIISVMFPCLTVFYSMCTVHHVALSVPSNSCSPHSRPNPSVKHSLVIKLPVPDRNIKQPLPYVHRFLQVVIVVGAPQASEDGGDVEWTVAHDVELALLLYPLVHCSLFPRHQIAVHIPWTKHLHSWVSQGLPVRWNNEDTYFLLSPSFGVSFCNVLKMRYSTETFHLKSPESSYRKLFVEVSNSGQTVSITEVDMRVGTKQTAHLAPDQLVLQNHQFIHLWSSFES